VGGGHGSPRNLFDISRPRPPRGKREKKKRGGEKRKREGGKGQILPAQAPLFCPQPGRPGGKKKREKKDGVRPPTRGGRGKEKGRKKDPAVHNGQHSCPNGQLAQREAMESPCKWSHALFVICQKKRGKKRKEGERKGKTARLIVRSAL